MAEFSLVTMMVGPLQTNAYLLTDPSAREAILIDPGGDPEVLLDRIEASGCRLVQLLCTHGHFDHVAAATEIQAQWDLPLQCHPHDVAMIERMPAIQASYGFPPSASPLVAPTLSEGHDLRLAGVEIPIRHVPGHSPGHIMFVLPEKALVGDCVFAGSIGRTDLPGSNFADLERSIRQQIYTLPENTELLPGHGPPTLVGTEMRTNPFVRHFSS